MNAILIIIELVGLIIIPSLQLYLNWQIAKRQGPLKSAKHQINVGKSRQKGEHRA